MTDRRSLRRQRQAPYLLVRGPCPPPMEERGHGSIINVTTMVRRLFPGMNYRRAMVNQSSSHGPLRLQQVLRSSDSHNSFILACRFVTARLLRYVTRSAPCLGRAHSAPKAPTPMGDALYRLAPGRGGGRVGQPGRSPRASRSRDGQAASSTAWLLPVDGIGGTARSSNFLQLSFNPPHPQPGSRITVVATLPDGHHRRGRSVFARQNTQSRTPQEQERHDRSTRILAAHRAKPAMVMSGLAVPTAGL